MRYCVVRGGKFLQSYVCDGFAHFGKRDEAIHFCAATAAKLAKLHNAEIIPAVFNARFLVFVNGDQVTITLSAGQSLEHRSGGPCEEGYSYTRERWHYRADGSAVEYQWNNRAADCDGRYDTGGESICTPGKLRAHIVDTDCAGQSIPAEYWPKWEGAESFQRDHEAERAGY